MFRAILNNILFFGTIVIIMISILVAYCLLTKVSIIRDVDEVRIKQYSCEELVKDMKALHK